MKVLLTLVSLFICGVVSEAPAPYPASGWRPNGPSFDLPERAPVDPRNRTPQKQEYLPPKPNQEYGPPEEVDVSVQGLPADEQLPIFQLSPVSGQQYVGPAFHNDLRTLDQYQRQAQLQAQQNIEREFARQRQLEAAQAAQVAQAAQAAQVAQATQASANANRFANQPVPRQFIPRTTTTTPSKPDEPKTTQAEATTEALNLNQGETVDDREKVSVEVSKQNIQEYPPELFLGPLAQLQLQQLQNQFSPVQLGQLRAPIFLEPAQKQVQVAYNAPAQLNAVLTEQQLIQQHQLAQQQLLQTQLQLVQAQQQLVNAQPQLVPTQPQTQTVQSPAYLAPETQAYPQQPELQLQYQPANNQYEAVQPVQTYAQPAFLQPQQNQLLPRPQEVPEDVQQVQPVQQQPQFVYQYQPEYQQPINQYYQQPLNSYQQQLQPQLFMQDPTFQQQNSGPNSLQSGFDVNQQGNGIDGSKQNENKDEGEDEDEGTTATAVATAFGTRTQPRVYSTYGAPAPVPRVQANPGYQTTTEFQAEEATEGPAIAEATAVARGERRKAAKLRSRQGRVRPIFTLDRNGHLVLAEQQQ